VQCRWLIIAATALAGAAPSQDLATGKLLVATRKSHDPDLARTVILLVHYDERGAIGLIVNRPSKAPLSDVMPELKDALVPVYAGGPLTIGVRALLRSRAKPEQAVHVFGDVSIISNKTLLAQMVAARTSSSTFRVYAGYTGWSAGELKNEVASGLWYVLAGDAGAVFDPRPGTVWPRLTGRLAHVQ
jgi:putative transcriptional regulator